MIKKNKVNRNGKTKTSVLVVEGYRPGPGLPPKQRVIKTFGYLEDQPDPVAFMAEVEDFNANYKDMDIPLRIEAAGNALMYSENNRRLNYGYKYLGAAYRLLGIDGFLSRYVESGRFRGKYPLADILRFLVLLRVLSPDSKRATFQMKDNYYGLPCDFELEDIYRALDRFADFDVELQRHLNDAVKASIGRDLACVFYDVTNYFFEIDFPDGEDGLRKRGVSKEHRVDPIVAMGLFMDANGIPVSMSLFPGNQSETTTLSPIMSGIKKTYGLGRLVVVADKGLNSSKNLDAIANNGDGYVISQTLKGKKGQRFHEKLFSDENYIWSKDRTYKHKLFDEDYEGKDKDGNKAIRRRKVLIYWSKAEADMARRKRGEKLRRAGHALKNGAYAIKKGVEQYIKEDIVDKKTGRPVEGTKRKKSLDIEKAQHDAMFDGYFCIITSEMDYGEREIRKAYGGLWKIEESFKVMKSDLYARPVFVWNQNHIRAHFLICFISLLIIRVIQHRMGENALSAERVSRALNAANCQTLKGGIIHLDDVGGAAAFEKTADGKGKVVDTLELSGEDEIALDYRLIQQTFGTDFYSIYPKQEVFNKFLKGISMT
jgi:transposase